MALAGLEPMTFTALRPNNTSQYCIAELYEFFSMTRATWCGTVVTGGVQCSDLGGVGKFTTTWFGRKPDFSSISNALNS
jgi:hypothetical protein